MLGALVGALLLVLAQPAGAVVLPAQTIDGPNQDIVAFGGVAMAEDGTGGLVYIKRVEGVAHVFAARFVGGHWLPPVRVDTENHYAASWARIGAAEGGELLVIWATPFATESGKPVEELLSSTLGAGSSTFAQPTVVDPDIREGTGTSPDLAMSSTGQADVVYRVVEKPGSTALLRAGDVSEQVRVAHYDRERWSFLGAVNRDPGVSMRPPTSANAPQIAVGPTGNGVVVWQEPEIDGVARIFARRIFGQSLNYVMPVSALTYNGAPINEDADAPGVAFNRLGQAEVVYRQSAGAGSPLPGPRIFLNILSDGETGKGAEFEGANVIDGAVPGGKSAKIGRPSIDIDERQDLRVLYDDDGEPRVITGDDRGLSGSLTLGSPFVGSELTSAEELPAASVMNPEGGGVSAWASSDSVGNPAVSVREDFPSGAVQTGLVSGGAGGPIGELAVGRSGLGDGLVAFQQGPIGNAAIVASRVSAPPSSFVLSVSKEWIKPSQATVEWQPAPSANPPVSYSVVLDGRIVPTPAGVFSLALNPHGLDSGIHQVQILATDSDAQQTLTARFSLRIDARAPAVSIVPSRKAPVIAVRVTDPQSGVVPHTVSISFGDGQHATGKTRVTHRYAHPGIYRITVTAGNKVGNEGTVRELVNVR